jgi:pSer/pThr/pTyr-binding forkhead associated (FHA) protein
VADHCPHVALRVRDEAGEEVTAVECHRQITLIGSRRGCKICLRQKGVSPVHAALVNDGEQMHVIDLVSGEGTVLNGLRTDLAPVADQDVLSVGSWSFRVSITPPAAPHDPPGFHDLEPTPQGVVFQHVGSNRFYRPNRAIFLMGRRKGCDLAIHDPLVSRAHALVFEDHGHPTVVDLLSENRTLVNDEPVLYRRLREDDVICLGSTHFRVKLITPHLNVAKSARESGNGKVRLAPENESADLIDIASTEQRGKWRIVDSLEKANNHD